MKSQQAKDNYLGRRGARLNCAQAVAEPFLAEGRISSEAYEALAGCGGGRAPEGYCGGVHAALQLAPEKAGAIRAYFEREAGSLTCREIRSRRSLPCPECVRAAAAIAAGER